MSIIWIDTETTGLDPRKHVIVDLWAAETNDLGEPTGWEAGGRVLISDADYLGASARALGVNGYDEEEWSATARSWAEVWADAEPLLSDEWAIIGGHNVGFDLAFLRAKTGAALMHRTIDTCALARPLVWQGASRSAKLDDLCSALGIPGAAHTARGDVERTIALYRRLLAGLGWRG